MLHLFIKVFLRIKEIFHFIFRIAIHLHCDRQDMRGHSAQALAVLAEPEHGTTRPGAARHSQRPQETRQHHLRQEGVHLRLGHRHPLHRPPQVQPLHHPARPLRHLHLVHQVQQVMICGLRNEDVLFL